jgi:hypothetical protein
MSNRDVEGARTEAESADAQQLEDYRLLVESIRDYAIFMLDPDGIVLTWNAGAERIKGYRADEIVGRHFSIFYPPEDAAKPERELAVAREVGRFEETGWRVCKDGSRFMASVVLTALYRPDGGLRGFAKVTRDLTEQMVGRAAQEANRAKDEFLAMLGHELRNPLAPIVTALEIMKLRGEHSSKEQQVIERQVNHLIHLVDDLLDVSRIARGTVHLDKRPLRVRDVVTRAVEIAMPLLEQRTHHLALHFPGVEQRVDGDEERLVQVVTNLLTNAAKYTAPGGHVGVSVRPEDGDVALVIEDDGIGIGAELLPHVFEPFTQAPQSADRARGGIGVGLTIVSKLVEMHGGSVSAASEGLGKGSVFTVRLPASTKEEAAVAASPRITPSVSRWVLVVDDNEDALEMVGDVLRAAGHTVATAKDGPTALDVMKNFSADVAVLDIGLPVMDGYELAREIRRAFGNAAPRLIALTGYGQASDRARSREEGFAEHLTKPVDVGRLLQTIAVA